MELKCRDCDWDGLLLLVVMKEEKNWDGRERFFYGTCPKCVLRQELMLKNRSGRVEGEAESFSNKKSRQPRASNTRAAHKKNRPNQMHHDHTRRNKYIVAPLPNFYN